MPDVWKQRLGPCLLGGLLVLGLLQPLQAAEDEGNVTPQILELQDGKQLVLRGTKAYLPPVKGEEWQAAPDGNYTLKDGYVLTVSAGRIPVDNRTPENVVKEVPLPSPAPQAKDKAGISKPVQPIQIPHMTYIPETGQYVPDKDHPARVAQDAYLPAADAKDGKQ